MPEGIVWYVLRSLKTCLVLPPREGNTMEKNMIYKVIKLGAVLAAVLLVSLVFVSAVNAQQKDLNNMSLYSILRGEEKQNEHF